MARINIEDSIFKEKSFEKLMLKLGSRREAIGALVEAFMLAQKHYLTTVNDRLIPLKDWIREEIGDEIIECGFAERRDKGIYVRGSDEQFCWLIQRSEAGKSSARLKAERKLTTVNDRSTTVNGSQPLTPSLSLSPSLSHTQTHLNNIKNTKSKPSSKSDGSMLFDHYSKLYQMKYFGAEVKPSAKNYTHCKQLVERLGLDGAKKVIEFYLSHNDKYYIKSTHSLAPCVSDADSLYTQMQLGKAITSKMVNDFEKNDSNKNELEKLKQKIEGNKKYELE